MSGSKLESSCCSRSTAGRHPLRAQVERPVARGGARRPVPGGTPLPSTRALARDLGVSRGVVVEAYEQLVAEGYLAARQGAPTRVADAPLRQSCRPVPRRGAPPALRLPARRARRGAVPARAWLGVAATGAARRAGRPLRYGDPRGAPELRRALAGYLGPGARRRVRPGTRDRSPPAWPRAWPAAGAAGARGMRRVGVEDPRQRPGRDQSRPRASSRAGRRSTRGLCVTATVAPPDAVVVTPAHQFPTGVVLAPERRAALVEWATARERS